MLRDAPCFHDPELRDVAREDETVEVDESACGNKRRLCRWHPQHIVSHIDSFQCLHREGTGSLQKTTIKGGLKNIYQRYTKIGKSIKFT